MSVALPCPAGPTETESIWEADAQTAKPGTAVPPLSNPARERLGSGMLLGGREETSHQHLQVFKSEINHGGLFTVSPAQW